MEIYTHLEKSPLMKQVFYNLQKQVTDFFFKESYSHKVCCTSAVHTTFLMNPRSDWIGKIGS